MQKKSMAVIGTVIVVVILVVGGYALFHKSPKTTTPSSTLSSTATSKSQAAPVNNAVLITKTNTTVGSYLADPKGNTLYTVGSGSTGVSNCTGACLTAWPVYQDKGSTTGLPTNVGTIKRSDNGEIQYTYKGMPLYYFSSDTSGQVTGNGVSGFSVATP
jgi:predicted lipoprotein with Yx(FWY)xxD motif